MLKSLTFSLSLAVALGFCSVSKAGGLGFELHDLWTGLAPRWAVRQWSGWRRDWLRVALCPQEALLQLPLAEDSLQPPEVAAHHQL